MFLIWQLVGLLIPVYYCYITVLLTTFMQLVSFTIKFDETYLDLII